MRRAGEEPDAPSQPAHSGPIRGLSVDACNRYLLSAGYDGRLRSWDFSKRRLKGTLDCGSPITHLAHHADTGMAAIACDDLTLRMYDAEVIKPRLFTGVQPKCPLTSCDGLRL